MVGVICFVCIVQRRWNLEGIVPLMVSSFKDISFAEWGWLSQITWILPRTWLTNKKVLRAGFLRVAHSVLVAYREISLWVIFLWSSFLIWRALTLGLSDTPINEETVAPLVHHLNNVQLLLAFIGNYLQVVSLWLVPLMGCAIIPAWIQVFSSQPLVVSKSVCD